MIGVSRRPAGHIVPQPRSEKRSLEDLPGLQVLASVDEPYEGEIDATWLEGVARAGLAAAGVVAEAEVSLLITGDDTVRALNAEYRGLDETTDVLSFSAEHPGHWEGEGDGPTDSRESGNDEEDGNDGKGGNDQRGGNDEEDGGFVLPPGLPQPLGEIIISWPQAQRQAGEHGVSALQELAHLVVHGALHLVGYDHVEPEEAALMQAREREALNALTLTLSQRERE